MAPLAAAPALVENPALLVAFVAVAVATGALVGIGVPALVAIGTAQVQSLAVTSSTAADYLSRGSVRPSLAIALAPAFVAGIVAGWYAAHRVTATRLRLAIGAALLPLSPLIAL